MSGATDRGTRGAVTAILVRERIAFWSRSLLVRVVVLSLIFTTGVMFAVGAILQNSITSRLMEDKVAAALSELEISTATVQTQLGNVDADAGSLRAALVRIVDYLGQGSSESADGQAAAAGRFAAVIAPAPGGASDFDVGPVADIPVELRQKVSTGAVARQFTTVTRSGTQVSALVVGAPAYTSPTENLGLYLIFPLTAEQSTVEVVRNTLLAGSVALAVLLTGVAALVAWQVVVPVRRAAAVARRLAGGDLGERMPVKGPIELNTLAVSFNSMADAIRAQIRQLEEFGSLQRRFTSDVSHELRTPVTTVRMAADLLYDDRADLPPHLGRSTELLVAELDRFESLLADLLEISRHDAGMAELSAEQMDVRSLVTSCVTATRPLAEVAGAELRTFLPTEPVLAEIDFRRVERILRNLLNNAVDHAEGRPIDIHLAGDHQAIAVTVTDHGIGLKPGEAGLVFNRFWRADPSRQRQTGGTGLGLAISLEDARLHGGWLQASGLPGVGARFRLTLPLRKGHLIEDSPLPLALDHEDTEIERSDRLASSTLRPTTRGDWT